MSAKRTSDSWEKPVKAILDHFGLDDVTIIGASLGGYLAPRAAAFEKRITKVVGWSIFPDFFDILLADDPEVVRKLMDTAFIRGFAGIFNGFYRKMMDKSELVKWNLMHGMYMKLILDTMVSWINLINTR